MDALLSPVGDKRPEKLCENVRGSGKPKRKEPETKVSRLALVKPGKPQEGLVRRKIST